MAKNVPTGVKIISVLDYIGAAILVILGLLFIFGGGALAASIPIIGALGGAFFIVIGIVFVAFAVLAFFVARGLWKAQKWAWIVSIIIACLGVLSALISMIQGNVTGNIFNLVVNGVIGAYLIFSKAVKQAFA